MTRNELIDQYFDWMYQLVVDNRYSKSYRKLFARPVSYTHLTLPTIEP